MRALLIVDMQRDFVGTGGTLSFSDSSAIVEPVLALTKEFIEHGDVVFTTQDWHDKSDEEFTLWPEHCLKESEGARLIRPLEEMLSSYKNHYTIHKKHYSAFHGTSFDKLLKMMRIDEVHVCGVVTHICVLFTVEELRNRHIKVKVYKSAVASPDRDLHDCALRLMKEVLGAEVIG